MTCMHPLKPPKVTVRSCKLCQINITTIIDSHSIWNLLPFLSHALVSLLRTHESCSQFSPLMVTKAFEPLGGFDSLLGVSETGSREQQTEWTHHFNVSCNVFIKIHTCFELISDYSVGFLLHNMTDFRVFFVIQFSMNSREIGSVWPSRERYLTVNRSLRILRNSKIKHFLGHHSKRISFTNS